MNTMIETIYRLGYNKFLGCKKKTPFFKGLNQILHAEDGPLFHSKKYY